ncbi:hypothetical protein BKA61DRAFT_582960 [Leptodontidium sp. MPI-SDFR-AT-0119]|nr:hypothetical protein BKA61DRAFT_582960 [Leptodontidium sp. MPI-SDFR-AT-0119]
MTLNALGSRCYRGVKTKANHADASKPWEIRKLMSPIQQPKRQMVTGSCNSVVIVPDLFYRDSVALNENMVTFSVLTWVQGDYGPKKIPHIPKTVNPIVEFASKLSKRRTKSRKSHWLDTVSVPNTPFVS